MKPTGYLTLISKTLLGLLIGATVLEGVAEFLAYRVYKVGRLFEAVSILGWHCIPDLNQERKNANGQIWTIRINEQGFRTAPEWVQPSDTHILIIGDSFAFGQGVNVNDRFDALIHHDSPSLEFKNIGIMGFGTDQELLAARRYGNDLRKGDAILVCCPGSRSSSSDLRQERIMRRAFSDVECPQMRRLAEGWAA